MADEPNKDFMGAKDAARDKAKEEALKGRGPSKISQELKAKQAALLKTHEKRQSFQGMIITVLIVVPLGVVIYSIFGNFEDKGFAMALFKGGLLALFLLTPLYLIVKGLFFKQSAF